MTNSSKFGKAITLCITLSIGAVVIGCGGGGGDERDPILGADVVKPLVVPPDAIVPPGVTPVPVVAPVAPPEVVVPPAVPPVVVPPVVVTPPVTPGLTCPATGPALMSTNPSNGNLTASTSTTGVAGGGKTVTANFSGTMNASGINSATFQLAQTGQPALTPASVGYDTLTKAASLVTSVPLLPSTDYTAVIEVPASSVPGADSGCRYAWAWTFKTAAAPVVTPSFVNFGQADTYAISATAGVANTAATMVNGNVVLNPNDTCNAVPVGGSGNFGLCGGAAPNVNGTVITPTYPNPTLAQQVTDAVRAAYLQLTPPAGPPAAGALGGGKALATTSIGAPTGNPMVAGLNYFAPGVYTSGSTINIAGDVVLDGQGDANAVFVFQAGSALTALPGAPGPGPHTRILLVNGAKASNVFWQAGSSATLGNYAEWYGNVLAGADITMQTGAVSCGRLFAGAFTSGAFVFDNNIVSIPGKINAPAGCL